MLLLAEKSRRKCPYSHLRIAASALAIVQEVIEVLRSSNPDGRTGLCLLYFDGGNEENVSAGPNARPCNAE